MFGKSSVRTAIAVGTVLLALVAACTRGDARQTEASDSAPATQPPHPAPTPTPAPVAAAAPDFATVSKLINDAIAANKLPSAVVVIGHGGKVGAVRCLADVARREARKAGAVGEEVFEVLSRNKLCRGAGMHVDELREDELDP